MARWRITKCVTGWSTHQQVVATLSCVIGLILLGTGIGCATRNADAAPSARTISDIQRLPLAELVPRLPPIDWARIREMEIERYVICDAQVRANGSVKVDGVAQSSPDNSWDELAVAFARDVVLATRGQLNAAESLIDPPAEIFIVVFKRISQGNFVIIFGREVNAPPYAHDGGRAVASGRQIGTPSVEVSRRPTYLRTFIY